MFFNSVVRNYGAQVYIPPREAFPRWQRPLLRVLSQRMVCRLHRHGLVLSGGDLRLRYLLDGIGFATRLENGGYAQNRMRKINEQPKSALAKRLDAIIWEYLQLTKEAAKTIDRLESQEWRRQNDAIQEQIDLLRVDLRGVGAEYAELIVEEINLHDRSLQPQRAFDQAVAEQLEQGKARQLLAEAQMAHDDLTVCRPTKSIAGR